MKGNILQSNGSTVVLIDYSVDTETNIVNGKLGYIGTVTESPIELFDKTTGYRIIVTIPDEVLNMLTYIAMEDLDLEIN